MQEITRVRALEGEIARTIQTISGIRAARVHIVMAERGNFRHEEQKPTASVVIRASQMDGERSAMAIRHLVAAAVPGLDVDNVTVLDQTGTLLAAGDDPSNSSLTRSMGVERTVETQIEANIRRALAPYLGPDNFRASVRADVNTDSKQIQETIYDPDSRVERSVQVVKSSDNSNQKSASQPVSVEQNLPQPQAQTPEGQQSTAQSDRREETTNYELSSKRIETVSNGFSVAKLSIAVVVNQQRLKQILGDGATPEQVASRVEEIKSLAATAAGLDDSRGDNIKVTAVEFIDGLDGEEMPAPGILDAIGRNTGTMINAGAFILVVLLVVLFGLRPMTKALSRPPASADEPSFDEVQRSLPEPEAGEERPRIADASSEGRAPAPAEDDLRRKVRPAPQERLARMVDLNEERTAQILRKWARQEAA